MFFYEFLINVLIFIKIVIRTILKVSFVTSLPKESKHREYQVTGSLSLTERVNFINRS